METVGVYLKKEREAKNISLREVSRLTKISEFYLDYIEKDEFEKLPKGPYAKGYISSYSRLIGGNVDEALKLYDSLNVKRTQTAEIQLEIPNHAGGHNPAENPQANEQKKSIPSRVEKNSASFKKVPASLRSISSKLKAGASFRMAASVRAAGASIKTIGPSIQKKRDSLRTLVPTVKKTAAALAANRWLTHRQTWRYACVGILGVAILILAGFGFYHLFIYDQHLPIVAEPPILQDKEIPPLPVSPADQKRLTSLSTRPDAAVSRTVSTAERPVSALKPAIPGRSAPLQSSLPAEQVASRPTTAGKAISAPSGQREIAASPSPEDTTTSSNLSVMRASICADIKNRMPDGVDTAFPPSVQRIYVWSQIEAKQIPSTIRHIYYFKGQKISDVTLNIPAAYWRTWSFKGIANDRYRGEWRVDITSAAGTVLRRLYFEVK